MNKETKKEFEKVHIAIEELARMTVKEFDRLRGDMGRMSAELKAETRDVEIKVSQKINGLQNRIDDIALNRAKTEDQYAIEVKVKELADRLSDVESKYK